MVSDKRVCFDFEVDFSNGGGIQGQDFRLDIAGDDITDDKLAAYIIADLRLLMVGKVRILNKRIIEERHKRAAVEEGVLPGGGTALLHAAGALDGVKGDNDDQNRGIDIIRQALSAPLRQIAENAGHDGGVVCAKLIDGNDPDMGFNAQTETYENLVQSGVIDPTLVVRSALQDAASVAGLLLTTEAAIVQAAD